MDIVFQSLLGKIIVEKKAFEKITLVMFQSLLGKIIGSKARRSSAKLWRRFQSLLGKIIVEYFTTYIILYTTSCVCQVFRLEKRAENFVNPKRV